jgi:nucleoside-diphosphate-sugar epimerase
VPFIPIFFGGDQSIQTIDLDDLVEGIARIVDQHLVGLFCLAEEEPVGLRAFYAELAKCQGARPRFVRLSGRASLLALRAVEKMGIRPSMTSENLLGLKNLRTIDVRERCGTP